MQINKPRNTLQNISVGKERNAMQRGLFPARLRHFHLGTDDSPMVKARPEPRSG